jgi:branched-chain amino acid transport system ATP-binding protein
MLSVLNLCVSYGAIRATRGISFEVPDGQLVSLVGANGAGKSSTLNAIGGLVRPQQGEIRLGGKAVTGRPAYSLVRLGISLVPEGRMVAAGLTVQENLLQCRQRRRCTAANFQIELDRVFALFPKLYERRTQKAGSLSGGEQQMLAISRALVTQPRVLMLDEPSMGLAPALVDAVFGVILAIHDSGQTILMVEQNVELALESSDYMLVLQRGEIAAQGTPAELRGTGDLITAFMG